MTVFLERVNPTPLQDVQFSREFVTWIQVLVDTLNSSIEEIEYHINVNGAQSYTQAEIAALNASQAGLPNGVILYDTTNNCYVGKENGVLVRLTTSAYP